MTAGMDKRTEADMLALLRARHAKHGNGGSGEWAFLTHVRNAAGFAATRTIDALALSLWPSRGFELHGFEVKVSRSDWLRELADPAKADGMMARCDRWWLVAAEGVAKAAEMPTGWGLLVAQGDKLRAAVQAPKWPRADAERLITRDWLVCLLRAAGAVPKSRPEDVEAAYRKGCDDGAAFARVGDKQWQAMYERANEELRVWRSRVGQAALDGDYQIKANLDRLTLMAAELENAASGLRRMATSESGVST